MIRNTFLSVQTDLFSPFYIRQVSGYYLLFFEPSTRHPASSISTLIIPFKGLTFFSD